MFNQLKNQWIGAVAFVVLILSFIFGGGSAPAVPLGGAGDTTSWTNDMVFNQDGHPSADFRIETDTNANAFFVDAGNDIVTADFFTEGGGITTLSDTVSVTLTEAQLLAASGFQNTASSGPAAAQTITFPATSTMTTLLPSAGDKRTWTFQNNYGAEATTSTFAAGTGGILLEPAEGDVFDVAIDGGAYAIITAWRKSNTDVVWTVMEATDAD